MERGYLLHTLGCKANGVDGLQLEGELQKRGWRPADVTEAEICIVNSCTVTDEADRQSRKFAARLKRLNPRAKVIVTGCAAEVDPERMARSAGIDYVVGNRDKAKLVDLVLGLPIRETFPGTGEILGSAEGHEELRSRHPIDREWPMPENTVFTPSEVSGSRTRAFLKIQDGCNAFCTYCIIPYGRGPTRSLDPDAVIAQVNALVASGTREIVFTGINLGDYGLDREETPQLVPLLRRIFEETSIERVRVSSLDPLEIEEGLLRLMETESRLCPHVHVSLQSPHSKILKLMKRKYTADDVGACLRKIAAVRPAAGGRVFVGMDVITGFPGETESDFEWTRLALESLPWTRLHVFPYSERAGTPATRLPAVVPPPERARRAKRLRELSFARLTRHYEDTRKAAGDRLEKVLFESLVKTRGDGPAVAGYDPGYLRVLLRPEGDPAAWRNRMSGIQITGLIRDETAGDLAYEAITV